MNAFFQQGSVTLVLVMLFSVGCTRNDKNPESALQELSHLTTLECEYTIISAMEKSDPLCGTVKCLSRYKGKASLGFDLEKATVKLVGKSLSIGLPPAELVNYKIDSSWEPIEEQYTRLVSHTTYNRYRDEAETDAQKKLKAKALDPQITRIAADQAKLLLRNFYEINFPELTVSFSPAKDSNQ